MKNRGFTLAELITAMVISSLVILATAVLFVAEYRFRTDINNEVYVAREAKTAMSHMARTLRFAKPTTVSITSGKLDFTIEAGNPPHLPNLVTSYTSIEYNYNSSGNAANVVYFKLGSAAAYPVAYDITHFNPVWNSTAKNFTIDISAKKGNAEVDLHTVITTIAG